ncbi:unnamed protein product [Musa acuminata subsp. burmannicoides]
MPRSCVYPAGHADGARHVLDRIDGIPSNERSVRASAVDAARIDPHPEPSGGPANRRSASDRGASPAPIRFPPGNFKHSLTLFSKSFSSFPRGTCSLSVSRPYLALDGIYRPIGAAFPNNPTRRPPFRIRPRCIAGPHPLPSRQFQALFDSLFKVLFIFPSRYLFAIGLSPIFSLGRNLPPDWGCIPKQPDSSTAPRGATGSEPDGALTLPGAPFQGTWARSVAEDASPDYNSDDAAARFSSWADPGSPLLRESS